ncbi:hypothetical protein CsSME_00054766 [Camellia sinensis var. sinensis]
MPRPRQPSQSQQHAMPGPRPTACHARAKASSMPCHGQDSPAKASSMPCQGLGQQHAMPRPRQASQSQQHAMPRPRPEACHATANEAQPKPATFHAKANAAQPKPAACLAKAKASRMSCHGLVPQRGVPWPWARTSHATPLASNPVPRVIAIWFGFDLRICCPAKCLSLG